MQPKAETLTYLEAIRRGLTSAMDEDERVILLGEDIAVYGGAFKLTAGLLDRYGSDRVIDTPICETGLIGAAIGAAQAGLRPVVEIQFIDFISCGFNQLTNFAATCRFRWRAPIPMVVRGPSGGGVHAGPFHSQCVESFFQNTAGLKMVVPATATDAYRLIRGAILDPDPVLFFEQKVLYRTLKEEVDEGASPLFPGRAALRREGQNVSIITYGSMVQSALQAAALLSADDAIETEVLDLRSLAPLDRDAILETARKTGKVVVLHEASRTGGFGGEIAAQIAEHAFEWLDAPIRRLGSLDIPVPFAGPLEDYSRPSPDSIAAAVRELSRY